MSKKPYYITTAIAYQSWLIQNTMSIILADSISISAGKGYDYISDRNR